ncbi:MAG: LytR C-terminal domain-containing protein [Solirubrobacterales bacterium]
MIASLPASEVVNVTKLIEHLPAVVSVASALALVLLTPLYRSQRRDVLRLRTFMADQPDHPVRDLAASEAALDRAEAELERLGMGPAAPGATPTEAVPAARRVTSERPALTRITMERAALQPHPRWRRFVARVNQPRVLVAIALAALLLGAGGIFVSEKVLENGGGEGPAKAGKVDKASVTVAVLNGTSVNALGQKVGAVVQENGYTLGQIGGITPGFQKTEVLYAKGERRAARKVAKDLGLDPDDVKRIDREARQQAGTDADVVVIAGEDKAKP